MNLQAGFEETLPGRPVARLALADRRRVIVAWPLLLAVGILTGGQASKRVSIDFPKPAGERSAG
jgi:hypothetical protein